MPDRIILINKPLRWTSFDVVKKLKKPLLDEKKAEHISEAGLIIKNYKVGHAGTLDPLATGLLIICSGKLTRRINEIQDAEKEYTGTITIGAETESYDLEKDPFNFKSYSHISEEDILKKSAGFIGKQMQIAPIHSAKKIEGKRAYDMARRGENFEIKPNEVFIKEFEITAIRLPEVDFRIVCSKGTYIRSLAHEMGRRLGTGGYLSTLCRTRIGQFLLKDAQSPLDFLKELSDLQSVK